MEESRKDEKKRKMEAERTQKMVEEKKVEMESCNIIIELTNHEG